PLGASGGIGEGVVEGIEGTLRRDREVEAISCAGVLDREGERVLAGVPEQGDVDAVAVAGGEFADIRCCGAHGSSCHGMSTSVTVVAVVRAATYGGSSPSASVSVAVSTVHQIACPPDRHDASVGWRRDGLSCPLKEAKTTPHSCGSWWWWSK